MKTLGVLTAGMVLIGATWGATAAIADDDQAAAAVRHLAADQFVPSGPTANEADLTLLKESLAAEPSGVHPGRDEVSAGVVVVDGFANRMSVFEAERGQICFVGRVYEVPLFAACAPEFTDGGLIPTYSTATDEPPVVHGLVASDVSSVSVVTDDGKRHVLNIDSGGFWWTGNVGDAVMKIESRRNGEAHVLTSLFERPALVPESSG